ncbi:MAG TPA: hypothetical protein PKH95_02855 [Candidatus Magasanikbacteria bacterium]|nr:hypothetical protein [Candidatus Magasanikbacteria bacterium]
MKGEIEYNNAKFSVDISIEEIKQLIPFFIRALFHNAEMAIERHDKLIEALKYCQRINGWEKFSTEKPYLTDTKICFIFNKTPFFIRNKVKKIFIETYAIYSYESNNVFFAGLNLFYKKINKKDVSLIYRRFYNNNQAIMLLPFLEKIKKDRPKLLDVEVVRYLEIKQE